MEMVYRPTIPDEEVFQETAGLSFTRDAIVDLIRTREERRPAHNLIRNGREGEVIVLPSDNIFERTEEEEELLFTDLDVEYYHPQ